MLTSALVLLLQACGGGGGGGGTGPLTVSGMAATGAPLANATVQIYDKNGKALLATPATVQSDGSYTAVIPSDAEGPFVFEVDNGSDKLVSLLPDKSSSTVNITPLSHLVAAKLSATGNPYALASEIAAKSATVTSSTATAAVTGVMTALKPLATALSLDSSLNPLTASFKADGTGFDKMLDSLDVKVEPKGAGSQIEITLKQAVGEDADLPKIAFAHADTPAPLPTVDPAKLVQAGLTPKIQALLDQLTACYAVKLSERITSGGTAASAITAQACKDVFIGSDPTAYRSGGMRVAKTQHFGGIFTAESTAGVTFSDPKFFYQVAADVTNGPKKDDVVFGYRWKDEFGNFQIERNIARLDTDGKLRLVGNQYRYDIGVGAYSQRRNFVTQSESTYSSVGYSFGLSCSQLYQNQSAGQKIVKVKVSPLNSNRVITLVPNQTNGSCNYSFFVVALPKNSSGQATVDGMGDPSTPTGTGFVRLQTRYESGDTTTANHPSNYQRTLAFALNANGEDFTNAEIENLPQFGTWKFEYYTTTTAGSQPVATQYFKTTARSLTVDGFRKLTKLPELTKEVKDKLAGATCNNNSTYCYLTQASGPFEAAWTGSTDAGIAPATYMARIFGRKDKSNNTTGFEDSIKFRSTARRASISCGQGEATLQSYCTGTAAAANFGTTVSIDSLDLVSRAPDGTDVSHFHSMSKLR